MVEIKNKDIKEENDLSDKGIAVAPKPFKDTPYTLENFDFGEEQSNNIQILKNIKKATI